VTLNCLVITETCISYLSELLIRLGGLVVIMLIIGLKFPRFTPG
jgi:hypothetical protein